MKSKTEIENKKNKFQKELDKLRKEFDIGVHNSQDDYAQGRISYLITAIKILGWVLED